jgi:hypothetical protein
VKKIALSIHTENIMNNEEHSPLPVRGMRTAKNKKRPKPPKRWWLFEGSNKYQHGDSVPHQL